MSAWIDRLTLLLGPRGYQDGMRRSLQSVILMEAKRCVEAQGNALNATTLKPFQRKYVLMEAAQGLIRSLPFLSPHQREEVLWRTATSKETLNGDIAYKRIQQINKECYKLAKAVRPFVDTATTHEDWVNRLEQHLFECAGDHQGRPAAGRAVPANWAHGHNHVICAFRLYYRGDVLDPDFPPPVLPHPLRVPQERPKEAADGGNQHPAAGRPTDIVTHPRTIKAEARLLLPPPPLPPVDPLEARRKILAEVKEHLDLLKEFEGVISEDDLAQRKRELFAALPPAPPSAKKVKQEAAAADEA